MLGVFAFILVFSAFPVPIAKAASAPYFTITLIAPTSNPVRRQWAQIIQNSFVTAGIDAHLVYMSFTQWLDLLLGNTTCPAGTTSPISGADNCPEPPFAQGGWDAGFVGNGGGTVLPDFGTQNVVLYRGDSPNFFPPNGQNYYWWKNSTYNSLAAQYSTTFDAAARLPIAQKMVQIVAQDRPGVVLLYPENVYAFSPSFKPWGTAGTAVTSSTAGLDWQHWATGTTTTLNVALTGDLDSVNPFPNAAQNSLYDRFIYGAEVLGTGTQETDARGVGVYILGIASAITSDAAHINYTETLLPNVKFQDGTTVTADDMLFSNMALIVTETGYVGSGTFTSVLGNSVQFTYSNGTTDYVNGGIYQHGGSAPAGWNASSVWKSHGSGSFSFTVPSPYLFTNPLITTTNPIPMHLYEQVPFAKWTSSPLSGFTSGCTNGANWKTCTPGGISNNYFSISYNSARFGGNGSLTHAYGPIGAGAYVYHGYDSITQTATLTKFPGFWNATGLASMGQFTLSTIHVTHIAGKDAAIAAYGTSASSINWMDANYQFDKADITALNGLGAHVAVVNDPANGWQEMPLNNANPLWGTGTATPLGTQNPSQAAFAARMVRTALNLLTPRDSIVTNLLQGLATPGITEFFPTQGVVHAGDIYAGISADPYNQALALSYLAAAGYDTGYKPPGQGSGSVPVPPIQVANISLNVPGFFLGNSFTLSGTFPVLTSATHTWTGAYITLQESTDNGQTWAPVALGTAGSGGYYDITYTPTATGNLTFRVFYTGIPVNYINGTGGPLSKNTVPGPGYVESYVLPRAVDASGAPLAHCGAFAGTLDCQANMTNTLYSAPTTLNVGTYQDLFSSLATSLNAAFQSLAQSTTAAVGAVNSNVASLSNQVSGTAKASDVTNLQNQVSTLTSVAYAALAVAVVLGLLAIFLSRRKPS